MEKATANHELPPKPPPCGGGDKLKRDEWGERAVASLLEAYEAKWVLRNRAKLKGHDWQEVARFVSATADAPKTQTQCKNKIESMKKRYRSAAAATAGSASTWPFYQRIHNLLRGDNNNTGGGGSSRAAPQISSSPLEAPSPPPFPATAQESNGLVFKAVEEAEDDAGAKLLLSQPDGAHDKALTHPNSTDSASTTPAFYRDGGKLIRPSSSNARRKRKSGVLVAESVRWLAEAVVRTEKARMETMRELEKMRIEAEMKRGELELKRTRIIADTQLQIARLLSGSCVLVPKTADGSPPSFQPGTS
uniref:Myb/SANT-like DNA-binding domain-containing protein n=1 Tax=Kalanchoe fedtschenkoi TaxID=63787 RepID=A0A7N0ZX57_KALFE